MTIFSDAKNSIKPSDSQKQISNYCAISKCLQFFTFTVRARKVRIETHAAKHVQLFVEPRAVSEYDKWKYMYV